MLNKSLRETPKELKGKVKYNVSSKIDTGIRKDDELYSNYISPDGTDRGRLTTAVNSRGNFSPNQNNNDNSNNNNNNDQFVQNSSNAQYSKIQNNSMNRSFSSSNNRAKSINRFNKLINDPNQSNIKTLESLIFDVKNNCFEKIKYEVEDKTKMKIAMEKNIELIKNKIKLSREQEKNSFKTTHKLVQSTKLYQAKENRMNHEMMTNSDLNDLKVEVSRIKFEYENKMEENRQLRNEILVEEKNLNLAKEEFQKTNKLLSDSIKEKDNYKISINQLKKHVALMREKCISLEDKNKEILSKIYRLSLD